MVSRTALKKQLAPMVSEFLFYHEKEGTKDEKSSYINQKIAIRELIKDKKNRAILADILLDLKKDVSGDTRKRLFQLYKDLNLDLESFLKLKSWRWQRISQGMFELTQMQVLEAYVFISRFINDKRSVIRKQAEISIVTLTPEGISYFLDTTTYQISQWQQLKIIEVLAGFDNFQPPRFSNWLTSKNKHVVLFALRLIKHYDQNDTEQAIIALVRHKNDHIKQEAISCIKKFHFKASRSTLKSVFWKSSNAIKLVILDAIASFENEDDILFLEEVDKIDINFLVKSKALSAINTIKPGYVMPTEGLEEINLEASKELYMVDEINDEDLVVEATISDHQDSTPDLSPDYNMKDTFKDSEENFDEYQKNKALHNILESHEIRSNLTDKTEEKPKYEFINSSYYTEIEFFKKEHTKVSEFLDIKKEPDLGLKDYRALDFSAYHDIKQTQTGLNDNDLLSKTIDHESISTALSSDHQSIFKSLFEVSDDYCKLLLLDEILEVGNSKELSFLNTLHNHHNFEIRKKAVLIKAKLLEKIQEKEAPEQAFDDKKRVQTLKEQTIDYEQEQADNYRKYDRDENITEESLSANKELKSLDLCFVLEDEKVSSLETKPFSVFDIDFDVDFSEDLSSIHHFETNGKENVLEAENGLTKEEHSFFHHLLHFPSKLENKLNG